MKKILIYCCMLLISTTVFSQSNPNEEVVKLSPDGVMESVFDQYGNAYKLSDISVPNTNNQYLKATNPTALHYGYFDLYLEDNCGLTTADPNYLARRAVVERVLLDLSAFINSPLTTSGKKVNIWVRNINNVITNPTNLTPPPSTGVLGLASPFYTMPYKNTAGFGGIADNEVWKTIHTGNDSYTNVISPLVSTGINSGTSGVFYHGMMAFNFTDTVSPINWNTSLTATSFPNLYDLYTVILHEFTHALGFASLINANGDSKFGTGYNYYSRYDRFLRNNGNTQSLIVNTGACNTMYNYSFNTALGATVLHPSYTAPNYCTNAIRYVGATNVPVYTPVTFEPASSLSHFEDLLFPSCASPYGSNLYFTMSKAIGTNVRKRFLRAEERNVLGDLGYSVNITYGVSTTYQGTTTYTGTISGITVAGINDGITSVGAYSYIGVATAASPITINSSSNSSIRILSNDTNATGFECLQDVFSTATFSATSGTATTNVTFSSSVTGLHLLRYVPTNGTQKGNITYIYVYVSTGDCTPTACNIVNNGSFENATYCGQMGVDTPNPVLDCWLPLCQSPDIFKRGCTNHLGLYNTGTSTYGNSPGADSHNSGNNNFIGLYRYSSSFTEAVQGRLGAPLVAGQQYQISFWAKVGNTHATPGVAIPLGFSSYPDMLLPFSMGSQSFQAAVPNSVTLVPTTLVTNDGAWHNYIYTFTFPSSTTNHNILAVYTGASSSTASYVYVDDISIIPLNGGSFTLPANLCLSQSIADLSVYLSGLPTNGVFAESWVNYNGSTYSFNDMNDVDPGIHTISYTYTNASGCAVTLYSNINVEMPIYPSISGSQTAYATSPNNTTVNTTTIPSGYTALWTITGGTGTITTANNAASVGVTWSALPGYLTLTLTSPAGCAYTATQTIYDSFACDCLNTLYFTYTQTGARKATFTVLNSNPNCTLGGRLKWNYGDSTGLYLAPGGSSHTYATAGTYTVTMYPSITGEYDQPICGGGPYSASVTVTNTKGGLGKQSMAGKGIAIYPNPASSVLNLNVDFAEKSPLEVVLKTIDGKELSRRKWDLEKGEQDLQLLLPETISDGMIFVELISNEIKETRKVLIKK